MEALYQDVRSDGFFDGKANGQQLLLPAGGFVADAGPTAYALDDQTARFTLGQSVENFIHSDRNQSGLSLNDVLPLIQQLTSNSDARLFRTSGSDFDHEAPAVAFSATYTRADAVPHGALAPTNLVGGTVTVTADITDVSTVQGATLKANGKPLTTTVSGHGTHLVLTGTVVTSADGPLVVMATTADVHGNTTTPTYALTVDNTPPTLTIATGSPTLNAYYSSTVPVDVSAFDANGVASLTRAGFEGFTNLSGVMTRLTGVWQIPAGQAEGTATMVLTATDSAFNVATLPLSVNVDRTAPTVSLAAPLPPRYTTNAATTLHVTAHDAGAGVSAIKASVNGAPEITIPVSAAGTYDVPVTLGPEGNKRILLWATDRALPAANSSYNSALVVDLTRDATNPAPVVQVGVGSCYDERPASTVGGTPSPGMGLMLDSAGIAVVPVVYTFPAGAAKRPVVGAGDVYKAATRLSWGPSAPTVAQLYAQDGISMNVPFIVYDVPVTNSQSPITTNATYTIGCTKCDASSTVTGTLLRDPSFTGDPQRFLLPLSVETVPFLAGLGNSTPLQVHVSFTDEAGNAGSSDLSLMFHVIGPPVIIAEDSAYSSLGERKSLYAYRTGPARTYAALFDPSNPGFDSEGPRVIRYLVQNPAPVPVALAASLGALNIQHVEAWNDTIRNASGGTFPDAQGLYSFSMCTSPSYNPDPPPCGGISGPAYADGLYRGHYPPSCTKPAGAIPGEGGWNNPAGLIANATTGVVTAFQDPQPRAGETQRAATVPGSPGTLVIPAAAGIVPGRLVVYVNRPLTVSRGLPLQLADVMSDSTAPLGSEAYSFTVEDFWYQRGLPYNCCDSTDPDNPQCFSQGGRDYALRRHARYLASASTVAAGAINFNTQGLGPAATGLLGEASQLWNASPFNLTFTH